MGAKSYTRRFPTRTWEDEQITASDIYGPGPFLAGFCTGIATVALVLAIAMAVMF